jgi:hypothetical protein
MVVVVPGHEATQECPGMSHVSEAPRVLGLILERFETVFAVGIVDTLPL